MIIKEEDTDIAIKCLMEYDLPVRVIGVTQTRNSQSEPQVIIK
ncbi:MAG: hypothetical protein NTY51_12285 [Deltaproteobacteria bacterium]|nr:hypothetical protein [Deltaproteobacteria bacterium]